MREKLAGDLRNFKEFDFETLKYDDLFGCMDPQSFDGDDTYIIRAVYVLLFGKAFPDMTDWREIGTGKCYRGDTIHTFHTVFGRPDPARRGHFRGIDRFAPVDDALYERIRYSGCIPTPEDVEAFEQAVRAVRSRRTSPPLR